MTDPVTIAVAGEPVAKGRPRFVRATGRAFSPAKTRSYEAALRYAATQEMAGRAPLDCPVAVELLATMAIPASWSRKKQAAALTGAVRPGSRPDLDNIAKACTDAINVVVIRDDSLIVDMRARKVYGQQPGIVLTVSPL